MTRNKLRIAVDVDGVLAEQVPATLPHVRNEYGVDIEKSDITSWDEDIPNTNTNIKIEIENRLKDPKFIQEMDPSRGARDAMIELKNKGHTLIIATQRNDEMLTPTLNWLKSHNIPYDKILSTSDDNKGKILADILIDDYPKNIIDFIKNDRVGILFEQPWNENNIDSKIVENDSIFIADDWLEVLKQVEQVTN